MDAIPESKKNHLWRKIVWHTDPDLHPLGPYHSAEVYCCEESNGYAVWYVRKLPKDDTRGIPSVGNADYLLNFYAKNNRDDAIERAVILANSDPDSSNVIAILDTLAINVQRI